jgi:hypothetical protein
MGTDVFVDAGLGVSVGNGGLGDGVGVDVCCAATGTEVYVAAGAEVGNAEPDVAVPAAQLTRNIKTDVRKTTWERCVLGTIPFPHDAWLIGIQRPAPRLQSSVKEYITAALQ